MSEASTSSAMISNIIIIIIIRCGDKNKHKRLDLRQSGLVLLPSGPQALPRFLAAPFNLLEQLPRKSC
jgi:hypothetical protein